VHLLAKATGVPWEKYGDSDKVRRKVEKSGDHVLIFDEDYTSAGFALQHAPEKADAAQPVVSPSEVEGSLQRNCIEDQAACKLRRESLAVQRALLDRGSLAARPASQPASSQLASQPA
jgi:hypothetical protein